MDMAIKPTFSNKIKEDLRRDFSLSRATTRSKFWFFLNIGLGIAIIIVWVLIALPTKKHASVTTQQPAQTQEQAPAVQGDATKTPSTSNTQASGKTYTVQVGDSLYDIGTKTGVDWMDIATYNGIQAPYNLTVGQKLKLSAQ